MRTGGHLPGTPHWGLEAFSKTLPNMHALISRGSDTPVSQTNPSTVFTVIKTVQAASKTL